MINVNNEFQSLNRFNSLRTGPKDDLEMLSNLILYLCNDSEMVDLDYPPKVLNNPHQRLIFLHEYKKMYTFDRTCKNLQASKHDLHIFCFDVKQLTYSSKPNYERLGLIMQKLTHYEMQKMFDTNVLEDYKNDNEEFNMQKLADKTILTTQINSGGSTT